MTNSDYLLKAAIKKVTEKLNEILVEKIEEATNIAQDAPEILKKEFDNLKESIIEEASRMEKSENIQNNDPTDTFKNSKIKKALNEIEVHYKKAAKSYRKSQQYIKMINLYPTLQNTLIDCKDENLIE